MGDDSLLVDTLVGCCIDLFRAYGAAIALGEPPQHSEGEVAVAATSRLTGELVGSVVFAASRRLMNVTSGERGAELDWTCELANQLTGRFKNELRTMGASVRVAPPIVAACRNLLARGAAQPTARLVGAQGVVCIWSTLAVHTRLPCWSAAAVCAGLCMMFNAASWLDPSPQIYRKAERRATTSQSVAL